MYRPQTSLIEMTWNPVSGCTKVSPGCHNCYAEQTTRRLKNLGVARYRDGFQLRIHEDLLTAPLSWETPRTVFVGATSDLFHKDVPASFIERVFEIMARCPQHQFQVLTKRATRLVELAPHLHWAPNINMGVSVEDQKRAWRAEALRNVPAAARFLAVEPLLGPIDELPLAGIDWIVIGGEIGPRARPVQIAWIDSILSQCQARDVPFVFEQWGGVQKNRTARLRRQRVPGLATS